MPRWILMMLVMGSVLLQMTSAQASGQQNEIVVEVSGATGRSGIARVRLAMDPTQYEGGEGVRERSQPIGEGPFVIRFPGVEPGVYAVILYVDENRNGELDTNLIGVPREPFGFSNNPRVRLSRPGFEEARFRFDGGRLVVPITLN